MCIHPHPSRDLGIGIPLRKDPWPGIPIPPMRNLGSGRPTHPLHRMTHTCENITFPQLRCRAVIKTQKDTKTRLHSSRMHTARALTISPSMLCEGVSAPREVSAWGGCLPRGCVYSGGCLSGGVSTQGGVCSGGVCPWGVYLGGVCPGGVSGQGVSASWGVSTQGGVWLGGVYPGGCLPGGNICLLGVCWDTTPPLWTEWMTDTCKNITFANYVCGR